MSIATLKRKTLAKYNNSSVGQPNFSINGTRRSAGYVGQDTLGRCLVRSLSRWGALKGHGGCCGSYPIHEIKTSPEMSSLNNPAIVKSSSLNNNGLLMTKYSWIRRPHPFITWKPDHFHNNNSQSSYIDFVARATIQNTKHEINELPQTQKCKIPFKNYHFITHHPPITKPDSATGALNASDHIRNINKKCGISDRFYVPRNTKGVPFGCPKKAV